MKLVSVVFLFGQLFFVRDWVHVLYFWGWGVVSYQFNQFKVSLWGKNIMDEKIISRAVNTQAGVVVEDSHYRQVGMSLAANW